MRCLLLLATLLSTAVWADAALEQGRAIAQAADARLHGHGDMEAKLTMVLVSPRGETASRALRVKSREMGGGERTLMIFDTPRDVAGTALLSQSQAQADDEQWLYLPALKRVKQIGARNKSGPFMASEFAFEDIATPYWQKYEHRYLRDEALDGLACQVLERRPLDANSGYSRQLVWIDRGQQLLRRIEFYDRAGRLLKTYTAHGFAQTQGQWRPAEMRMVNQLTGRQTRLLWADYRFGQGLAAEDFNQNALLRAK